MNQSSKLPAALLDELKEIEKTRPLGRPKTTIKSNGQTEISDPVVDDATGSSSSGFVEFNIGIDTIKVPEMTWDILEQVMPMLERRPGPDERWYQTKVRDFEIFLLAARDVTTLTLPKLKKCLTLKQANDLSRKLINLLELSGFVVPGEAQATVTEGSTETLTVSSPESSPEEEEELLSGEKLKEQ